MKSFSTRRIRLAAWVLACCMAVLTPQMASLFRGKVYADDVLSFRDLALNLELPEDELEYGAANGTADADAADAYGSKSTAPQSE